MMTLRTTLAFAVSAILPAAASAQATDSAQATASAQAIGVLGGYVLAHTSFDDPHLSVGDNINGWLAGVDVPIAGRLDVSARMDGQYGDAFKQGFVLRPLGGTVRPWIYTITGGPRFALVSKPSLVVFADGLFGVAHSTARAMGVDALIGRNDTKFVGGAGGGLDVPIQRLFDVQVDLHYRRTDLFDQTINLVQVGASLVVRPGRSRAPNAH